MQKYLLAILGVALMACSGGGETARRENLDTMQDSVSYAMGINFGYNLESNFVEIDPDLMWQGFLDGYLKRDGLLKQDEYMPILQAFQREQQKTIRKMKNIQAEVNKVAGEEFLKENAEKPGVVQLESGLQFKIITAGDGEKPGADAQVRVHYTGRLLDGTVFDSSVDRGEPATFRVNQVITGWTEALQLMPTGSKWELYIPGHLAYGARGSGNMIKPNATLIFEVELLGIE